MTKTFAPKHFNILKAKILTQNMGIDNWELFDIKKDNEIYTLAFILDKKNNSITLDGVHPNNPITDSTYLVKDSLPENEFEEYFNLFLKENLNIK